MQKKAAEAKPASSKPNDEEIPDSTIQLRGIEINGFKALDRLILDLPEPMMSTDPDVFVLGSRNGLGKTSVLEACSLFLLAFRLPPNIMKELFRLPPNLADPHERRIDPTDLFVRSGAEKAEIKASVSLDGKDPKSYTLTIARPLYLDLEPEGPIPESRFWPGSFRPWELKPMLDSLFSIDPEPLISPPLFYFHSYRKVSEGALEPGAMIDRGPHPARQQQPVRAFKKEILNLLMDRAGMLETTEKGGEEPSEALALLDEMVERYAGGRIGKLKPDRDNNLDLRIVPAKGVPSFSFDGLSSGQKEVISTLFLIWRHTRKAPGIILIDEPELHLNPEWQSGFVRQIQKLTPESQIIMATHSEDVWGSVPEDRRILLRDCGSFG